MHWTQISVKVRLRPLFKANPSEDLVAAVLAETDAECSVVSRRMRIDVLRLQAKNAPRE